MDLDGTSTIAYYDILFTAQKLKKFKTWQDGRMKYYSFNKKLEIYDEKGYNIDRKFSRTGRPEAGDEIEFDGHVVTVESYLSDEVVANQATSVPPATTRMAPQVPLATLQPRAQQQVVPTAQSPTAPSSPSFRDLQATSVQRPRKRLRGPGMPRRSTTNPEPSEPRQHQTPSTRHTPPSPTPAPVHRNNTVLLPYQDPSRNILPEGAPRASMSGPMQSEANPISLRLAPESRIPPSVQAKQSLPQAVQQPDQLMQPMSIQATGPPSPTRPISLKPSSPEHQQPSPPQRRSRVGLSKRNATVLHDISLTETALPATAASPKRRSIETGSGSTPSRSNTPNTSSATGNRGTSSTSNALSTSNMSSAPSTSAFVSGSAIESLEKQQAQDTSISPFRVPSTSDKGVYLPLALTFPGRDKALTTLKARKPPKRTQTIPTRFSNSEKYKDTFRRALHEHFQILLLNYAIYYHSVARKAPERGDTERYFRSKGLGFYGGCKLESEHRYSGSTRFRLRLSNREHHSKYSKDDVWVISKTRAFEPHGTFLGRSTYYGPFSDGKIEVACVAQRDERIANSLVSDGSDVFALRTISGSSEFMMLDALSDSLDALPLLPHILSEPQQKGKRKQLHPPRPLDHIRLTRQDNIDVAARLDEAAIHYTLNPDQESVLRQVAKSIIVAPGWNEEPGFPITLVHGVFGAGKSYLAAVIIIFLRDIVDTVNDAREPNDQILFRIMISSMTNVAVDRILASLLELGYDAFVRIGSLKKIAKNILPYTVQSKFSGNDELKELELMLEDPQNSEEDSDYIATAIQKFRKREYNLTAQTAGVVGTTCVASVFEVFEDSVFGLVLLDEASQLMEPLTLVPLVRFRTSRLILVGDPLQLPPTLTTTSEDAQIGQGLDKTLFDRLTELGIASIMLRTQYRCHPAISGVSNQLFYQKRLMDGVTVRNRKSLIEGLPPLTFVDVMGQEERNIRSNSFSNQAEVALIGHAIEHLLELGLDASAIGVIALYKEQVDRLYAFLGANLQGKRRAIQISTVDAFQGGEKDVILLSTVRTTESGFIDNHQRVNVALTRAKRHLIILGKQELLTSNNLWTDILMHCQDSSMTGNEFVQLLAKLQATVNES